MDLFGTTIIFDAQLLALCTVVLIAGILRGFAGFGSALIVVPALAMYVGPAQAVVIEVIIEIPVTLGLLPTAIQKADRKTVLPMIAMFVLFVPIGAFLLRYIDPTPMKILLSLLVLVMLGVITFQRQLASLMRPSAVLVTGALAGLSQGLTAIGGPIFATAILARNEAADQTRANLVALAAALIALSVASFWFIGLIHAASIALAIVTAPALILGVWLGSVLFGKYGQINLRLIVIILAGTMAIASLWQALS